MALLLRSLRELRTLSCDSDLPPLPDGSGTLGELSVLRHSDEPMRVSSYAELCEDSALPDSNAGRMAQALSGHALLGFEANPSLFATSSTRALRR